jgi:hypothetical protein
MARKAWGALSGAYRARLERAGIDRAAYERGVSLKAARGHARSPERPRQAARALERYPDYVRRHGLRTPVPGGEAFDVGPDVPDAELREWLVDQASKGRQVSARITYDDLQMYRGARAGPGDLVLFGSGEAGPRSHGPGGPRKANLQARYLMQQIGGKDVRQGLTDIARGHPDVERTGRVTRVQFTSFMAERRGSYMPRGRR